MTKIYTSRRFAVYEPAFQADKECVRLIQSRPGAKPADTTHDAVLTAALKLYAAELAKKDGLK